MSDPVEATIEAIYRAQWPALVAILARWTGDLDRAEDAAADAVSAALAQWPTTGVPVRSGAWLQTVARRRIVDRVRRDGVASTKLAALAGELRDVPGADAVSDPDDPFGAVRWSDAAAEDLLRLIFTCCHPALAPLAQLSLAQRLLCGLTAEETARLLLTSEATVAQRVVRAKRKVRDAGITLSVPSRADWPDRLDNVLAVVGLVFTEGHAATSGDALVRPALCDEALRLAARLRRLLPDESEVLALSALLLLTDARRDARCVGGRLIPLDEQDRRLWRWADIGRGLALETSALRRAGDRPGPWVLQAAIAALQVHPSPDREAIVALYGALAASRPSGAVLINRAAAVARAHGPRAGLDALDDLVEVDDPDRPIVPGGGSRLLVLRAELTHEYGLREEARRLMELAVLASRNLVEREHLQRRLAGW